MCNRYCEDREDKQREQGRAAEKVPPATGEASMTPHPAAICVLLVEPREESDEGHGVAQPRLEAAEQHGAGDHLRREYKGFGENKTS